MATTQDDVLGMLEVCALLGTCPVVAGGWGVDALVGRQTREHRDLDVLVPDPFVAPLIEALCADSYVITTDRLPIRVELSDTSGTRHIDIHPAFDDGKQGWWQHGFDDERFASPVDALTHGTIGGRRVRCFTAAKQLELHQGYASQPHDLLDIAILEQLVD